MSTQTVGGSADDVHSNSSAVAVTDVRANAAASTTSAPSRVRASTRHRRPAAWRRLSVLAPAMVGVLTAIVGSIQIGHRSLWQDEYSTWFASTLSWHDFMHLMHDVDLSLAPYYVFLHLWIDVFGDSAVAMRVPSLITMAVAAGLVVALGRRLYNLGTGVLAGLIFAAIPVISRYGQEARPYGFVMVFALVATLLLVRAWESPTWTRWLIYAASMVALGFAHVVAITLILAHAIATLAAMRSQPRQLWKAAAAAGVVGVFVLPYAALTSKQKGATHWITVNWQSLERYPHDLVGTKSLAGLIFALALLGTWRSWRDSRAYAVLLVTWAVVPPIVMFAGGERLHLFLFRYFLFTLPAWVLLTAAGAAALGSLAFRSISEQRRRTWAYGVGAAAVVAVVALTGLTAQQLYRLDPLEGTYPDFRAAALTVVANEQPGDGIAYGGNSSPRRAFLYEMRTYPRPRDLFLAKTAAEVGQYRAVECTDTASCVGPLPHRIWLVSDSRGKDPLGGLTPAVTKLFTVNYQVQHVYKHTGIHVVLLVRKTSG